MRAFTPVNPGGFHLQRLRGGFQPIPYQQTHQPNPRRMGQININPNIQAPINIGLGSLPLSVGLFAGSGMALLIGSQVKSVRSYTTVASIGLAVIGALNLIMPKGDAAPAAPATGPVAPGQTSGPIAPTSEDAFRAVDGRILSPSYGDTISVSRFGQPSVPMRVRLTNKSNVDATFDLVISSDEDATPFGTQVSNSQTMRVTIPAGQTRDVDVSVGISTWGFTATHVDVDVTVSKRRIDGGDRENLAGVLFVVN